MFAGDPAPFVMELPAYHWPTVSNVLRRCGREAGLSSKSRYDHSFIYHRIMVLNELRMGEWKLWNG